MNKPAKAHEEKLDQLVELNESLRQELQTKNAEGRLPSDHRIARLEDRLDKIWDDHAETKQKASVLEERISHLPTKPELWKALGALFAAIAALITFGEKIQGLVN